MKFRRKDVLRKKRIFNIFILIFLVIIVLLIIKYSNYRKEREKIYSKKIKYLQEVSLNEKNWILSNQDKSGAIYMYDKSNNPNDISVNPYFSCIAAEALISNNATNKQITATKKYLKWQRENFLKESGEISNYKMIGGKLVSTGEKDSVDSYVAVFISLLSKYGNKTGSILDVDPNGQALKLAVNKLENLTYKGLTETKQNSNVYYLMDNLEVWQSYKDLLLYLDSNGEEIMTKNELFSFKNKIKKLKNQSSEAIKTKLWNKNEKHFEIGINKKGVVIDYKGFENFYPDAICQIYCDAFSFNINDNKAVNNLYKKFCNKYDWQNLNFTNDVTHVWANLSYIAISNKDYLRAEKYINTYKDLTSNNRKYPLYTAEAGWVIKSSDKMSNDYYKILHKNILIDIFEWIKGGLNEQ